MLNPCIYRGQRKDNKEWIEGQYITVVPVDMPKRRRKAKAVILPIGATCNWFNKYFYGAVEVIPETVKLILGEPKHIDEWDEFMDGPLYEKEMQSAEVHAVPAPRPCEVDGQPCTFHRWVDADQVLLNIGASYTHEETKEMIKQFQNGGVTGPGCSTEVLRNTYALVEYPDGSIGKVAPELVKFTDKEDEADGV